MYIKYIYIVMQKSVLLARNINSFINVLTFSNILLLRNFRID
jgi:hypothetical protein